MIVDGKSIALQIEEEIKSEIIRRNVPLPIKLVFISVGDNEATNSYIRSLQKIGNNLGIEVEIANLTANSQTQSVIKLISELNNRVDGILVGRPLPSQIDAQLVVSSILPEKDIDCLNPINLGRLFLGTPLFTPCTPQAVIEILHRTSTPIPGKKITIIGRSNIVGKPLAVMLIQKGVDATVTICHTRTNGLESHTRAADILIAAAGSPELVRGDMVKAGAVVIDVGINVRDGKLIGDVKFQEVEPIASLITPVPGGVGPITTRVLIRNALLAKCLTIKSQ